METTAQTTSYRRIGWISAYVSVAVFFMLLYFLGDEYLNLYAIIPVALIWLVSSAMASFLLLHTRAQKCVTIQYSIMTGFFLIFFFSVILIRLLWRTSYVSPILSLDLWLAYGFILISARYDQWSPLQRKFIDPFFIIVFGAFLISFLKVATFQYRAMQMMEELNRRNLMTPIKGMRNINTTMEWRGLWVWCLSGLIAGLFLLFMLYKYRSLIRWWRRSK